MGQRRRPEDRFFEKITESPDGCWLWTACINPTGYGWFNPGTGPIPAHRWCYEYMVGEIPEGLDLDHLCRVRRCVNPAHLDPVTRAVNIARGEANLRWTSRSACSAGHPYEPSNVQDNANPVGRICRACARRRSNAYKAKQGRQECPWCGDVVAGVSLRRHAKLKHQLDVTANEIRTARESQRSA